MQLSVFLKRIENTLSVEIDYVECGWLARSEADHYNLGTWKRKLHSSIAHYIHAKCRGTTFRLALVEVV